MQRLQISGAVRTLYGSLGVEGLISEVQAIGPTAIAGSLQLHLLLLSYQHRANTPFPPLCRPAVRAQQRRLHLRGQTALQHTPPPPPPKGLLFTINVCDALRQHYMGHSVAKEKNSHQIRRTLNWAVGANRQRQALCSNNSYALSLLIKVTLDLLACSKTTQTKQFVFCTVRDVSTFVRQP